METKDGRDARSGDGVRVRRYRPDMGDPSSRVLRRGSRLLSIFRPAALYLNPQATVVADEADAAFYRAVRRQQARWCRQYGGTLGRASRRKVRDWRSPSLSANASKYDRYLDRAVVWTGVLFVHGRQSPPHEWPAPEGRRRRRGRRIPERRDAPAARSAPGTRESVGEEDMPDASPPKPPYEIGPWLRPPRAWRAPTLSSSEKSPPSPPATGEPVEENEAVEAKPPTERPVGAAVFPRVVGLFLTLLFQGQTAMSHELAETADGRPAMMYAGTPPWHGLGTRLENPATSAEALAAAGLDFTVELSPLHTAEGTPVPGKNAAVRSDTGGVLGVVGDRYRPIQNRDCFSFMDSLSREGAVRYHTAGALGDGERVWVLAKLPGRIRVLGGDDVTEKFLLLSTTHDGTAALRVHYTPVRVVCSNTLAMAHRQRTGPEVRVRHTGDPGSKVAEARQILGTAEKFYEELADGLNALARHTPKAAELEDYFQALYPDPKEGRNPARSRNVREELFRLFERGVGQDLPAARHTSWAALNAVTEYVDHHRTGRGETDAERRESRLASAWFGSGARLKGRAYRLALQMATAA